MEVVAQVQAALGNRTIRLRALGEADAEADLHLAILPPPKPNPSTHSVDMDGVKIEFVLVGKGAFWMGSPENETGHNEGREAQKEVTISEDFYIGKYEVTQEQWEAVMGKNPSYFSRSEDTVKGIRDEDLKRFPVETVSWEDIQDFLRKLNEREKARNNGWLYRLPKTAEWEYSCRGGPVHSEDGKKTAPFYFAGPTFSLSSKQANFNGNYPYGDVVEGTYFGRSCKVGSYLPNALGIHDMHGNVWEWCDDLCPGLPDRMLLGGGWYSIGRNCRAAERHRHDPKHRESDLGFRLVRVPSASK